MQGRAWTTLDHMGINSLLVNFQLLIASIFLCTWCCAQHFTCTVLLIPSNDPLRKNHYSHFIDGKTRNTERCNNFPKVALLVSYRARILIRQSNSRPHVYNHLLRCLPLVSYLSSLYFIQTGTDLIYISPYYLPLETLIVSHHLQDKI